MDLGTAITLSVSITGFFVTILKLISVYVVKTHVRDKLDVETCAVHAKTNDALTLTETKLSTLEERITTLNDDIETIKRTVIAIASFLNIPIKEIKVEIQELLR